MRKFLVVLDDSNECLNAVRYAAMRAASTGGAVQALGVIPADDIQHGFGVAEVMRTEARERIEAQFEVYAKWMRDRPRIEPELVVREGDPATELLAQIGADTVISFDRDGSGTAFAAATLVTLRNLDASTLTAENLDGFPTDGSTPEGAYIAGTAGFDRIEGTGGADTAAAAAAAPDTLTVLLLLLLLLLVGTLLLDPLSGPRVLTLTTVGLARMPVCGAWMVTFLA